MRFAFTILLVGILFLSFVTVFHPIETCSAAGETLHVGIGQTHSNIQDAINAANESDTIYVHSGTYNENIVIDKALILTGEDRDSTIIMGVSENDITLTIKGNFLEYVSNVRVSGLQILQNPTAISNKYACMYIEYAQGCTITDCIIKDSYNGIRMKQTDESTISENTIESNEGDGILLFIYSDKNEINNNLIKSNKRGIYLQDFCTENIISNNDIFSNTNYGIRIIGSSNNNIIYHNDFENSNNANDECSNMWHYSSEGNYWNDYTGSDPDGDGIGDIPYNIPGSGNQDLYPLGYFSGSNLQPVATIQSISPNPATEGRTVSFNGYGTDYDGSIVAWEWKVDGVTVASTENFSSSGFSVGTHSVTFRVQDNHGAYAEEARTLVINPDPNVENNHPVAVTGGPYTGVANNSVSFDGSNSYDHDEDDSITSYQWDFGDGSTGEGIYLNHTYVLEGNYTVKLTVTDEHEGQTNSTTYANISIQSNGQNGNVDEDDGFPGFELIFVLIASIIILFWIKKRKRKGS